MRITDKRIGYKAPGRTIKPTKYFNGIGATGSINPTTWFFGAGKKYFVYLPIGLGRVPTSYLNELYMLVPHDTVPQGFDDLSDETKTYITEQVKSADKPSTTKKLPIIDKDKGETND